MSLHAFNAPEQTLVSLFNIEAKLDILNEMIIEVLAEQRGVDHEPAKEKYTKAVSDKVQVLMRHYEGLSR